MTNITDRIGKHITDNGFELGAGPGIHSCGVVSGWHASVKTNVRLHDGADFVAVYADRVVFYGLRTPYYHNNWQPLRTTSYDSPECLLRVLEGFCRASTGCWA